MKEYLTVADVAEYLAVTPSTVRSYLARQQMPPANDCPCCGLGPVWWRESITEWRPKEKTP